MFSHCIIWVVKKETNSGKHLESRRKRDNRGSERERERENIWRKFSPFILFGLKERQPQYNEGDRRLCWLWQLQEEKKTSPAFCLWAVYVCMRRYWVLSVSKMKINDNWAKLHKSFTLDKRRTRNKQNYCIIITNIYECRVSVCVCEHWTTTTTTKNLIYAHSSHGRNIQKGL